MVCTSPKNFLGESRCENEFFFFLSYVAKKKEFIEEIGDLIERQGRMLLRDYLSRSLAGDLQM